MVKYYCDRCRNLYNDTVICRVCGEKVSKKIVIEVQNNPK